MNHEGHEGHEGRLSLPEELEALGREVIDSGLHVHRALGPGLLESAYEHCLAFELQSRGLTVRRQAPLPVVYKDIALDVGYRLDLLVQDAVIIEIKAVEALSRLHEAQILTYLKLSKLRLGFIFNFNAELFKHGLRRFVL